MHIDRSLTEMNSIRKKFTALNLLIIFLCTFIMGGMGFWFTSHSQEESSEEILRLTCREEVAFLNQEFYGIQHSVEICAEQAMDRMPEPEVLRSDSVARGEYIRDMEKLMGDAARRTIGANCYYLRIAPELADETSKDGGFFYAKKKRVDTFLKEPLTPILKFDPSDEEHVGWYYVPMAVGKSIWMEPYYNKNIDMEMISYIAPLYKHGKFVGVVGMDIDFNLIINDISIVIPYKTSYTTLVSRKGKVYYHPTYKPGTSIIDYIPELKAVVSDMKYTSGTVGQKAYNYKHQEKDKKLVFAPLYNNMVLLLSVEASEVNKPQNRLLQILVITAMVIAALAALINLIVSIRITTPLKQLTEAADQIAAGNLDVELPSPGNDEVGRLIRSFGVTVNSLKEYISGMKKKVYIDPLTHVKNKNAYELEKERLQKQMRMGIAEYALLMMDVNHLKMVNDTYGHDYGDLYLLNCCRLICRVFQHSPVYRIGGDEFLVLLENSDYQKRDELLAEFDRLSEESWKEKEFWKQLSVAKGLAVCSSDDTTPEDLQRRADHMMYEDKKRMKTKQ